MVSMDSTKYILKEEKIVSSLKDAIQIEFLDNF